MSRVNCGGRNLTLEKVTPPEILPLITNKLVVLKRPYVHYGARAV